MRDSLIPTSVLAGGILLLISGIYRLFAGVSMFDTAFFGGNGTASLEVITYHTLALGFIASALKNTKSKMTAQRTVEIFNTGVTTVATYLLQAVFGLGITIVAALVTKDFFPAAGILLPFGYGQGTSQALNYGTIFENDYGFEGGKSFGLTIAALGFLSASIGGVLHLNLLRKRRPAQENIPTADEKGETESSMQGSLDRLTVQAGLIALVYFLSYLLIYGLGELLPGMKSVIYGFNFLIGVLVATLVKAVVSGLHKKQVFKKDYINNFLLTRCSNCLFDRMVVAGIAAFRLSILEKYWGIILILGVVGLVITYVYLRIVSQKLFPAYEEEQFLSMYGMLTGTASTGIILLREIDKDFKTPAADNLVYQNFPAIVFGFPLMLLATLAPQKPVLTLVILIVFFLVMNVILFRSGLFRKKKEK